MEVVEFVSQLGRALWSLKGMYDQDVENTNEIKELQSFIQDFEEQIPIIRKRFLEGGDNVMGKTALKTLEKDVEEASNKIKKWSRNKSFFRVFNSVERMQKLGKLHTKVMASVHKSLVIASLSVLLDLQDTQPTILESIVELKSLLITSIESKHGTLPSKVSDEVEEARVSSFGDPKFWKDVLVAIEKHNVGASSMEGKSMYEDPITTNLMIDPVVASDGNTYCRWTIIDNNSTRNPFNVDENLKIVIDNLNFQRRLFERFPEQFQPFQERRNQYRNHALSLRAKGLWGDASLALHHVLQWNKDDRECVIALKEAQEALQDAKEMYLQPTMDLSNEPSSGGSSQSSMHEMVIETSIDPYVAKKLFKSLLSYTPEVRKLATHDICHWFGRDVKFQSIVVKKGGFVLLALLLPFADDILQEHILYRLLDIGWSMNKDEYKVELVNRFFPDLQMSIVKVLKKGSTKVHELVARILFHLSTKLAPWGMNEFSNNFDTMDAMVTFLGNGTLQVRQIVSSTLNNLIREVGWSNLKTLPTIIERIIELITRQEASVLEEALPLLHKIMIHCGCHCGLIRDQVSATIWLEIMASKSPLNREWSACILCSFCNDDPKYRQQVKECLNYVEIEQLAVSFEVRCMLLELLNSEVRGGTKQKIPFPKKVWWSPPKN